MSKKNLGGLTTFFNSIIETGLSPNQFYLLYSIKEKVAPLHLNVHQELRGIDKKWYNIDEKKTITLTSEGISLMQKLERYFKLQSKKTSIQIMGSDYLDKVEQYLNIFPKIKLPSGKPARSNKKNVEAAFRWFFENYEYDWETVFKAAEIYVDDYKSKRYMYMQTSQYFIRKQTIDKNWRSELADWCIMAESGEDPDSSSHFTEKVV